VTSSSLIFVLCVGENYDKGNNMRRYNTVLNYSSFEESIDGQWMKYEDIVKLIRILLG
jgi:hypothetical protein